uniref:Uncharacterized protein n=1 Tax=Rhizophora mucronata TaxID=61149 RepID=A0A2P2N817_RHIMU
MCASLRSRTFVLCRLICKILCLVMSHQHSIDLFSYLTNFSSKYHAKNFVAERTLSCVM